ncbi:23S rRNA pseudouridine1911/1915/1917 synthase [Peptoniphilus asaccharolyticus DSM 20463]|uniref:Pseudouridine synthase n=1 Tax=Peptoniphilus asaccharolyticus DSM 20463 TaxID=573058 RepID=A0A1W1UR40_PEPAS|nr:RluA family pseudouridine synthase [Peptoniphilus asaccharolyticus]MBL7575071.1 RluA family pseudouridine synthase [Peptoniphilus asaccharolyticus]SMB83503.1 23S rRNA pseudouridine1911/1915/1917 synthase [Peptoniphilus asaccharolyticus DSM 20463]
MYQNKFISNLDNERLDIFLNQKLDLSRSQIKKLVDDKLILVNGKSEKAGYKLRVNDEITVEYREDLKLVPQDIEFRILFEDSDIAVISKPQGLVVHPGAGNEDNTLVNGLLYRLDSLADTGDELRPGIVHRLDKDTSGLMIVAKTSLAYDRLIEIFKNREINKVYMAIVEGKITDSGFIDEPIGRDSKNRIKFAVTDINSKEALTYYKPIKVFENHTFLEIKIATGRTHQIRVHMKYINHPVLGDPLYGRKNKYKIDKQMLHACKLQFKHPITDQEMLFEDEIPIRFEKFMKRADI